MIGALSRGEKALSWQSPGGALTICEPGNGALCAPFQGSRADAKQMRGKRSSGHRSKAARNAAACKICSAATRARCLPRETLSRRSAESRHRDEGSKCRCSASLPHKKRAPTMALMLQGSRKNREASFVGKGDAGAKENSLSKLKLFQNAPCGDVVGTTGPRRNP